MSEEKPLEELAKEHSGWFIKLLEVIFEFGKHLVNFIYYEAFKHGYKHGMSGKFTKKQIDKAISKSYEHNSFNQAYFWSELEGNKDVQI